jgi:hypothetical protein
VLLRITTIPAANLARTRGTTSTAILKIVKALLRIVIKVIVAFATLI